MSPDSSAELAVVPLAGQQYDGRSFPTLLPNRTPGGIACELGEELSFDVPREQGDVVLVDNCRAMHGRRAFTGTRKVLASLVVPAASVRG